MISCSVLGAAGAAIIALCLRRDFGSAARMQEAKPDGERSAGSASSPHVIWRRGAAAPIGVVTPASSSFGAAQGQQMAWFLERSSSQPYLASQAQTQPQAPMPAASNGLVGVTTAKPHVVAPSVGYQASFANSDQQLLSTEPSAFHSSMSEYFLPHNQGSSTFPYAESYFGGLLAAYGTSTVTHPHVLAVQQTRMTLPLDMSEDGPVYVNAKQYHGILRRRQSRAKAELANKIIKARKPYLHESRHLHALRRARGCGGRFLNTKKVQDKKKNDDSNGQTERQSLQNINSSGSESLTYENEKVESSNEIQDSSGLLGSEVTSLSESCQKGIPYKYTEGNGVVINSHASPHFNFMGFNSLSTGMDDSDCGQGMGCPLKWITAETCCDPMKG